jgi:Na+-translocating ferredoxin:NAD+ oxidoreductase RnfA subunit
LHTKITHLQLVIWIAVILGQLVVGLWAYRRRNSVLVIYLGVEVVRAICVFAVARLAPWQAYEVAYWIGWFVDYAAHIYLVVAIFKGIRKTGIPSKNHPAYFQGLAFVLLAASILTLRYPLSNHVVPAWKWYLAIDHVAMYWLCLMLIAAPLYAYMVDSAKDARLLLIYLGFALYIGARSGAVDTAIGTHLARRLTHVTEISYLFSLVLWFLSSYFSVACHQWDPAQTEHLKTALRARSRSHLHELLRHERSSS